MIGAPRNDTVSPAWGMRLGAAVALILALRLVALAMSGLELSYDEAQYWAWSRHFAFGYFTKPGLIAWLIGGTTAVCGDGTFCVRLPAPILHAVAAVFVFLAARRLYDGRVGFWSGLAYMLMPGISVSSLILNTDVPLLAFWCAGLYATVLLLERPSAGRALFLALTVAGGLNAKYAMIYLPASTLIYLAVSAERRPLLRRGAVWFGLLGGLLGFLPNLLWNAANGFVTFRHTGDNAGWAHVGFRVGNIVDYVVGQLAIPGPILFVVALAMLTLGWRSERPASDRLLLWHSWPILIVIGLNASIAKIHGNWAATAFPALVIVSSAWLIAAGRLGWLRLSAGLGAVVALALLVGADLVGHVPLPSKPAQLHRLLHWSDYGRDLTAAAHAAGTSTVVTVGRPMTSQTLYQLRDSGLTVRAYLAPGADPADQFEMTIPYRGDRDGPALLVTERPPETLGLPSDRLEPLPPLATGIFTASKGGIPLYRLMPTP